MFYEPASNFYYNPKSKVYYNGKNGEYLAQTCIEETGEIVFKPIQPPPLSVENRKSESLSTNNLSDISINNIQSQPIKPLSITLINKNKNKMKSINFVQNPDQSNIAKWNQKQKEERTKEDTNSVLPASESAFAKKTIESNTITQSTESLSQAPHPSVTQPAVKSNQIICYVCRRQFSSQELLQRHEKESKLHADNLKKLEESSLINTNNASLVDSSPTTNTSSSNTTTSSISSTTPIVSKYRDRAEERRELYGSSSDINIVPKHYSYSSYSSSHNNFLNSSISTPSTIPTDLTQDETNMGHQLLKKMGWNENNNKEALGVTLSRSNTSSSAGLGHDSRQNIQSEPNQTMYYNKSGQDYKNVLMSATRNRFDMLFKNEKKN